MKKQVFRLSRGLWAAISVLFILALAASPLISVEAGRLEKPVNRPADVAAQDIGGQDEEGSSAPTDVQTSAFLAGKVAVGLVALESNGANGSLNEQNWNEEELKTIRDQVWEGLQKWVGWKPADLPLEFVVDINGDGVADDILDDNNIPTPVEIPYEPISDTSGLYTLWTKDALQVMNYGDGTLSAEAAAYLYTEKLREENNADWAFVLFVVDSSEEADNTPGAFTDYLYMRARTFGPIAVMTNGNDSPNAIYRPEDMQWTTAQLVARMFGASFQREGTVFETTGCASTTKKFGYLGIPNSLCAITSPSGEPNPRLMYHGTGDPDSTTKKQVGWLDTDGDGIIDLLDTGLSLLFAPYFENPTSNNPLTYDDTTKYRVYENPLQPAVCAHRPAEECFVSYYDDVEPDNLAVTINRIDKVEYRIDGGAWSSATLSGPDPDTKTYSFTTPTLEGGRRKIEVRAQSSSGNFSKIVSETVTVAVDPINDLFHDRIVIGTLPYSHAVDTSVIDEDDEDDSTDPLPISGSCQNNRKGKRSVWYEYDAIDSEDIYLDTYGTRYTTVISVWKNEDRDENISNSDLVACKDGSDGKPVSLSFTPEAGTRYYFMISEYNNIAGPIGGTSDVSGQAGGVLVFKVSKMRYSTYLPMVFKKAFGGSYNSAFYIQNTNDVDPTKVVIEFYNETGELSCATSAVIDKLASQGWWLPGISCLPDNWVGSIYIRSTLPVVAVARPHVDAEVMTYTGFVNGATEVYLPMLFKNAFDGSYQSAFYIQNVDEIASANITIKFYNENGGVSCTLNDSIQPLASKGWWLPGLSCLPKNWVGSAVVVSNKDIVAVGRPHIGSEVMTYSGFTSGSATSYLPMLFKNAFVGGSYKSAFYIQNVDTSQTATITIKYYNDAGVLACTTNDTIAPLASKGYWLPGIDCLPSGWVGGIEVTSNQPIVMIGRPHIDTQITTYNSFSTNTTRSFIPMLFKKAFDGSYDAAFYVQNAYRFANANITIRYYDSLGDLACTTTDAIAPLASKGYWLPGVECLSEGWVGGAVITSDQPIVTVGRPHISLQITTYTGLFTGDETP